MSWCKVLFSNQLFHSSFIQSLQNTSSSSSSPSSFSSSLQLGRSIHLLLPIKKRMIFLDVHLCVNFFLNWASSNLIVLLNYYLAYSRSQNPLSWYHYRSDDAFYTWFLLMTINFTIDSSVSTNVKASFAFYIKLIYFTLTPIAFEKSTIGRNYSRFSLFQFFENKIKFNWNCS